MEASPRQQWPPDGVRSKPLSSIPERRSSRHLPGYASARSVPTILSDIPLVPPPPPAHTTPVRGAAVSPRGNSSSPLRRTDSQLRRAPSRTFVPSVLPTDLLDAPQLTHPRIVLDLRLSSAVFMGGASVEGIVHLIVDGGVQTARRKASSTLSISRISVTLVGIERCKGRQEIFRALTTDLIDEAHPPPTTMAPDPGSEGAWDVTPSTSILPFRMDLPVVMGPPPYRSKKAGINYLLSAMVVAKVAGKSKFVRQSREIIVLTVHDPEKALVNLSNPLLISDELHVSSRSAAKPITVVAGLHRQTWISGYLVFVDLQIDNKSDKMIKKIELQLEKTTTFHKHPAPSTSDGPAEALRLPDYIRKETLSRKEVSDGFQGVRPNSQDYRTCQMELPTGLVSIETGRFFGIRFFLNIQITCSFSKHVKVQLPITIIHPNSIDIPPNALAQVTASIEHKHRNLASISGTGSPYRYRPGQAFTAARRQSYLQLRKDTIGSGDMEYLTRKLEASPRRVMQSNCSPRKMKITRRQSAAVLGSSSGSNHQHQPSLPRASFEQGQRFKMPRSSFDTLRPGEQRVSFEGRAVRGQRSSLDTRIHRGLRGSFETRRPRLQRSTSGLAFDDSDKENNSPK